MADISDVEALQAALECAYLFREQHQIHQQPTFEDPEVLSLRRVNYLQISLKMLTLESKKFNDKPITIHLRIPMIRNQAIEYTENTVYDIGTTQKGFIFQNLIKSNFGITENLMGQISQCYIRFQITSIDVEIGKGEFALQTMILDQIKKFTYKIPIVQTLQVKNKKPKDVIVGELEFEIQLQDQLKQGVQHIIQKEIDVEEQSAKIKEDILRQIQQQKEEKQRLKQIQEEQDFQYLLQQIKSLQMHLNLQRLVHIFRDHCLQQIEDDQINIFFKLKSYGQQEIHQSEIYWNVFKLQMNYNITVPVTFESLQKMEYFPWIIELWAKNSTSNQDVLIGVSRLQLNTINSTIMNHTPLQSIQFLKGNLYPQTIYDQDIPFENLRSKQVMVVIRLKLSFGTTVQINRLINQEKLEQQQIEQSNIQENEEEEEEEKPISIINEPEQIPESPIEFIKIPLQESLMNVLNGISTSLRILPRAQYILKDEFIEIMKQLCGLQSNNLILEFKSLSLYLGCDEQSMDWQIFQNSWQSFTNYKNQLKDIYTKIYAHFYEQAMKIFDSINVMERALPHGQLYLLDQYELRDNLLLIKGGNSPSGPSFSAITINQVLNTLEINQQNEIQITQLLDYMRQFELHGEIRILHIPIQQIAKIVEKNITQWVKDNQQNIEQFLQDRQFQQSLNSHDLISIFQTLNLNITLLDAIIIMYLIGDYANLEQQDGEKICAEIAFWRYLTYLQDTPLQQPPSPIKPTQPKEPGIKRPKPIDYQYCISTMTLEILSLSQLKGKFNLQLHLEDTELKCLIPEQNSNFNNYKIIFTLVDKYNNNSLKKLLNQHLQQSGLNIIIQQDQGLARGSIAIEEILQIPEQSFDEFFIPIYDEVTYNELSLMECRISIKQQVVDEQVQENVQVYNQNGMINIPQQVLTMEQVIEKLKPETLHIFRITVKSIRWFAKCPFESLKFRVSLTTEKKILKHAIPQFVSDSINKDFDIVVEYQVKFDPVLVTQISKCHLLLELLLIPEKTLIGYLPIKQLIENKEIEGELPMDDSQSGAFNCTLNINTQYSTEEKMAPIIQQSEDLKVNRKIILRVTEFVLLDYEMELGEIYFMLVDPFNQSESYSSIANNPSITNTQDCIFLLQDYELIGDIVELQVRSINLGEDTIVGSVRIQLNQLHQCSIYSESNYLTLDTRDIPSIAARVAIQLIYVCTPEMNNDNFLKAFTYPAIKDLEKADLKDYLRNQLQFSYSEINLISSLLQGDVFSTKIFENTQIDAQGNNNLILDLLKEFQFYDTNLQRFVDPKYLKTIFGYFGINCDNIDMFIPSKNKRKPIDYDATPNQFDYLTYLVHLQKTMKSMRPLFQTNLNGPIQHEIQSAIKQKPKPKSASPIKIQKLHFEIISAHNLNQLQNRIPNAILKLPQLGLESRVYYSQSNPEFNSLISLEANQLESLQIQILDKRYNASNEQSIYSNQLIGMVEIQLQDLISKQFPYVFQVFLNENNGSKPAYIKLRVWSDNEEISPITQPLPKPNSNPIPKKTPKKEIDTVRKLVDFFDKAENDPEKGNKQDQTNAKTMKDLTNKIDQIIQTLNQQDNQDDQPPEQPPQFQPKQPEQPGQQKKQYFYSSSGSSSQPQQGGKSSDSGNKLDRIQERLPIAADKLKRIEQILRQNNLPIQGIDNNQSDSDDYE